MGKRAYHVQHPKHALWTHWGIWLLICCVIILAACDEVESNPTADSRDSSGGDTSGVLAAPTRTVKPIVSFTPRFTATPIPSATFTPSLTPIPTETSIPPTLTHTPTLTPTPTVSGIIQSTEARVNLRSGPSFDNEVILSVPVGSELGVIGKQADDRGREWFKVYYVDDKGEEYRLWVRSNLVATDYDELVVILPTDTPTPQARDNTTPEPGSPTRTPGATPLPERVDVLAYCRQKNVLPPSITTNDSVYIEWSWFVAREDQMQQHLDNANYEVRLDGELLRNWNNYATELKLEAGVWIIYWYYPVGKLDAGQHEVTFNLTWDELITDGYKNFGPGSPNESDDGNCIFSVEEP